MKNIRKFLIMFGIILVCLVNLPIVKAASTYVIETVKGKDEKSYNITDSQGTAIGTLKQKIVENNKNDNSITIELSLTNTNTDTATGKFTNVQIDMPLDEFVAETFSMTLLSNDATLDDTAKKIIWNIGDLEAGSSKSVKYKLKLNSEFDESLVNQNLVVNAPPSIVLNNMPVSNIDVFNCSPEIKIVEVSNPPGGVSNYIILGTTLLILGFAVFAVAKKNSFGNI